MNFTIITPSFNQLDYLKRCVASVADQTEAISQQLLANSHQPNANSSFSLHHHIQDGDSTDGTVGFLKEIATADSCQQSEDSLDLRPSISEDQNPNAERPTPKASSHSDSPFLYPSLDETSGLDVGATECIEQEGCRLQAKGYKLTFASDADNGMYDAINRGVKLTIEGTGCQALGARNPDNHQPPTDNPRDSVIAWLNCDEQYLPGTLQKVADFFTVNPEVDILFGGMLIVDPKGNLLSCRKAMPMRRLFLEASYLYNYSCAMFVRASFWKKLGGFDTDFKNAGDEELIRRAMKLKAKCGMLSRYLSVFTYSGDNLSSDPTALNEHEELKRSGSFAGRAFKLPINLLRLAEKFLRGGHVQKTPVAYEIYVKEDDFRTKLGCENPSCKWPEENKPYLFKHRLKGR